MDWPTACQRCFWRHCQLRSRIQHPRFAAHFHGLERRVDLAMADEWLQGGWIQSPHLLYHRRCRVCVIRLLGCQTVPTERSYAWDRFSPVVPDVLPVRCQWPPQRAGLSSRPWLFDDKWIPGALTLLIALGIHRSVLLPILAIVFARFLFRNVRYAIVFWISAIIVSLVAGGAFASFFAGLGFDDRMSQYTSITDMSEFSKAGFRWDFLLYSAAAVVMAWCVCIKKDLQDNWYNAICTVYCLCNAFWLLVIRSAFSNRFAYLSWFLYPIVIAYPLVNMPIREDQDRFTGCVLIAYAGFSAFMWFIFW